MLKFFIGLVIGACLGVLIMCILAVGKTNDSFKK